MCLHSAITLSLTLPSVSVSGNVSFSAIMLPRLLLLRFPFMSPARPTELGVEGARDAGTMVLVSVLCLHVYFPPFLGCGWHGYGGSYGWCWAYYTGTSCCPCVCTTVAKTAGRTAR